MDLQSVRVSLLNRPLEGKEKQMARSSRTTATASRRSTRKAAAPSTATPRVTIPREAPVHVARTIKNYTFEYLRDHVSRQAGASYFRVESNHGDSEMHMTLQEAQSLYNFLGNALGR